MGNVKQAEIKPCVVQFAEIKGFEKNMKTLDPEEYANAVQDITALYDETVMLYEGHVDKHEGKVFMATFGVPYSHEEDPERALKAALLLRQKIEKFNEEHKTTLSAHIGINLGKVYAGTVGSDIKKEFTVMGEAVNLAARIMERASAAQILVSEDIYRITKPYFQFSRMTEFQPQGAANKIKVYEVLGQRGGLMRRRGIEGLTSPLVGRVEAFNVLKEYFQGLLDGRGNFVTIIGDAGVGKSRLVEELFAHSLTKSLEKVSVVNWCSGYCSPYKETIYLPFVEIIRQICGIQSDDSEKIATEKLLQQVDNLCKEHGEETYAYLATLLNIKLDSRYDDKVKYLEPQALQIQTHLAISNFMKMYAMETPCVYVIDDLYLADSGTTDALRFFLESNRDMKMFVLMLTRPEKEKPFWHMYQEIKESIPIHEINLRRLSREETVKISENLLKVPKVPHALKMDMVDKADGNPFFLEEIIKLLIAEGILYRKDEEWHATENDLSFTIPYTIEAVIRNRFDTLNAEVRSTLEEMAVTGRVFSKKIVEAFSAQWETLDSIMNKVEALGFISASDGDDYSFNHALVREVIYAGIPEKRRKMLHSKIAETIEALYHDRLTEFYEILFEHFCQAEQHEKTIGYGRRAAENARKRYMNEEAILLYLAVLKELEVIENANDDKRTILEEMGRIHSLIGQYEDGFACYEKALHHATNTKQEAMIHQAIGDAHESTSNYDKALASYATALEKLDDTSNTDKARIRAGIGRIHYERGDYENCNTELEAAYEYVRTCGDIEARKVQAVVFDRLATLYHSTGKREKSFEYYQKALKLYEILDDIHGQGVVFNNICDYYTGLGDYPSALDYLQKSLEIDLKTGNLLGQAIVHYNVGDTWYQLGDLRAAAEEFEKSLNIHKTINNRLGQGYVTWGFGLICLEKNEIEKAEQHFSAALAQFNQLDSKMWQIAVMQSIADLYVMKGEYEKSWQLSENIMLIAKKIHDYDAINEVKIKRALIRMEQAEKDKKLSIMYLEEAKEMLLDVQRITEEHGASVDIIFEIFFRLSRVNYLLGLPRETIAAFNKATAIKQGILDYLEDKETQRQFLSRKLYRDFTAYQEEVKL